LWELEGGKAKFRDAGALLVGIAIGNEVRIGVLPAIGNGSIPEVPSPC